LVYNNNNVIPYPAEEKLATQIFMPRLGDSVSEIAVTRWLVEEGDTVEAFQPLLEVETSVVGSEIPSPTSGVMLRILVPGGEKVNAGTLLAWIGQPGETIPAEQSPLTWEPQFQQDDQGDQPDKAATVPVRNPFVDPWDETESRSDDIWEDADSALEEEVEAPVQTVDAAPSSDEKVVVPEQVEEAAPPLSQEPEMIGWDGDTAPSLVEEVFTPEQAGFAAPPLPQEPEIISWDGDDALSVDEEVELPVQIGDDASLKYESVSPPRLVGDADPSEFEVIEVPAQVEEVAHPEFDIEFSDPNETLSVDASKIDLGHHGDTPPLAPATLEDPPEEDSGDVDDQSSLVNFISPAVSRLAVRHQVDLSLVTGTGEGGRITKQDVERYVEARSFQETLAGTKHPPRPGADVAAAVPESPDTPTGLDNGIPTEEEEPTPEFEPLETWPDTQIQPVPIPTSAWGREVTLFMAADMQRAAAHLAANQASFSRDGTHLTYTTYFVTAAIAALKVVPEANISRSGGNITRQEYINIGLVVALGEEGVVIPVIKNANDLSLLGMARAVNELAGRSRDQLLLPGETDDATLTVVNYGATSARLATPLIYPSACIVLGTGAVVKRPTVIDDAIAIRPEVNLTLTFDPAAIDGVTANRFLTQVVAALESWE
jgi:pyruvate/2-oxoglutarate dehydrogenase complex dihydrolipoamide acyltransferase (E2) component